ncbi:MAG: DUF6371 domain-containing protein [Bacteroidales bacterium]|nr:DUF6371 domain-containing protein [Bacteroidales bacterium]
MKNCFIYQLEKYHGRSSRHQCPMCGRTGCFTLYVDADGNPVDETCGKCNHENSCGYHLTPKEFFSKNPEARKKDVPLRPVEERKPQTDFLPDALVGRSHSTESTLWRWVMSLGFPENDVRRVFESYRIGATRKGEVIYWQIDERGNVHDGKIMGYSTDGHRMGNPDWISSRMRKRGDASADFVTDKVLFGLHLLSPLGRHTVCLVEGEKTALIGAIVQPGYIWMATGGCGYLNAERLRVLRGHRIVIFPDSGMYAKWEQALGLTQGLDYSISNRLEGYPPNTDIADLIIPKKQAPQPSGTPAADNDVVRQMTDRNPALSLLIETFGLEVDKPP